ncbi:DUF1983 domain-containing protein [Pseudomonas baetica]|uniref:phage tail tip fiber protein n=1 Tax=Pseudomonas baetica TaxID=674054 RepID=UPI001C8BB2AF|nr:DUF1983 domain-containing protein [Pseudomonas baetica]MBX9404572.1 DUF1983 domain-containing protein [Pseudomonas baetica]
MQSNDYVPGVSGWKLNKQTGEFEINSCTFGSASKAPERQMVSVEVASYSKYDLPKNAANLVQFMEAELQKVPEEYRHAAEFEEFDASYGDGSFSPRLFLSYSRLETEEELVDRLEKAKSAGTQIKYEGGVTSVFHNGILRYRLGNLNTTEPEHGNADQPAKPFVVVDGTTYLNEAFIKESTIARAKIVSNWSVKMRVTAGGQYVAAGIGLGSQFLVSADRFAIKESSEFERAQAKGAVAVIELLAGIISDTTLSRELKSEIEKIKLDNLAKRGADDADCFALDRRLASIDHRLTNLESNRFRRPHAN